MTIYDVYTVPEAAKLYGVNVNTVKDACNGNRKFKRFLEGEYRRSGGGWLVTKAGMDRLFGDKKSKKQ